MNKKILRRCSTLFIVLTLVLSICVPMLTGGAESDYRLSPGPVSATPESKYLLSQTNVTISGTTWNFSTGGSVSYDIFIPFESDRLVFNHPGDGKDANLTITVDDLVYQTSLSDEGNATSTEIAIRVPRGSHVLTVSAASAITISNLTFHKINETWYWQHCSTLDISDYESTLLTTIAVKEGSRAFRSGGSMRYWDMSTKDLMPMNVSGVMYVPLEMLAESMRYYCEDYPDKNYILLRGETRDLEMQGGVGYLTEGFDTKTPVSMEIIYKDGVTWVPLRKIAETLGYGVSYRDGIAVVDDRILAREVVEDNTIFTELKAEFANYDATDIIVGKTYHVAKTGSDANDGTAASPFLTLNKAGLEAQAGDTVIIHEGTYRETFTPQNNGTLTSPIIFQAAEGEGDVIISALEPISGFTQGDDGLWYATPTVNMGFGNNQLFYQGEELHAGRHPNTHTKKGAIGWPEGISKVWPTMGNMMITEKGGFDVYSDTDLNQEEENYWAGGTFITVKGEAWTYVSGDIVSSEKGKLTVKDHDDWVDYTLGTSDFFKNVTNEDFGYITNHYNTVDMPGEWYMDAAGSLVLKAPDGANMADASKFETKARYNVINMNNRKNIVIRGIKTIGGSLIMEDGENNVVDSCTMTHMSHFTLYICPGRMLRDPSVSHNADRSRQRGESGNWVGGTRNALINNIFDHSAGTGLFLQGIGHYIKNNQFLNCGYSGGYPGALCVTEQRGLPSGTPKGGHIIIYNDIINAARQGLNIGGGETSDGMSPAYIPCDVAYNYLENCTMGTRDTGATYSYALNIGTDWARSATHHNMYAGEHFIGAGFHKLCNTFYIDGGVTAMDSYLNLSFTSQPKWPTSVQSKTHVYGDEQATPGSRGGNDRDLQFVPGGEDSLQIADYPDGKPFRAGSTHRRTDRFMLNYNNFKAGNPGVYKPSNNPADTSVTPQIFENVQIGGDYRHYITMFLDVEPEWYPTRDGVKYSPIVTLNVKNTSGETVAEVESRIGIDATNSFNRWYYYKTFEKVMTLPKLPAGTYTLEIMFESPEARVQALRATSLNEVTIQAVEGAQPNYISPSSYDQFIQQGGYGLVPVPSENLVGAYAGWPLFGKNVGNTWAHTFIYNNVYLETAADQIEFILNTGGTYVSQGLSVFLCDDEGNQIERIGRDVIADEQRFKESSWLLGGYSSMPLNRVLEPGTYNFMFKFDPTVGGANAGANTTIEEIYFTRSDRAFIASANFDNIGVTDTNYSYTDISTLTGITCSNASTTSRDSIQIVADSTTGSRMLKASHSIYDLLVGIYRFNMSKTFATAISDGSVTASFKMKGDGQVYIGKFLCGSEEINAYHTDMSGTAPAAGADGTSAEWQGTCPALVKDSHGWLHISVTAKRTATGWDITYDDLNSAEDVFPVRSYETTAAITGINLVNTVDTSYRAVHYFDDIVITSSPS